MDGLALEIAKLVVGPLVTAGFALIVGNRIAARWTLQQKHREQSLSVVAEFYAVYGQFFEIWKLANYCFREARPEITDEFIRNLVTRAAALEARIEAMLLRVASEMKLTPDEIRTLGLYRQAVQLLRASIILRRQLDFFGAGQVKYEFYKQLCVAIGDLVKDLGERPRPAHGEGKAQMTAITNRKWELEWHAMFAATESAAPMPGYSEAA